MKQIIWLLVCCTVVIATCVEAETLNNEGVIQIQKLGLGDSVIVEKIKVSTCQFDTGIEALKKLKDAGLSDAVIQAMIAVSRTATVAVGDPTDPKAPHEPGIWLSQEVNGKITMNRLLPCTPGHSGGWNAKIRAILSGTHASLQVKAGQPVFYYYFRTEKYGMEQPFSATSPNDIALCRMEVQTDDNHNRRRLVVGKNGFFGDKKERTTDSSISVTSEEVGAGIYRVQPQSELTTGEYAFISMPDMSENTLKHGSPKIFDFGVK